MELVMNPESIVAQVPTRSTVPGPGGGLPRYDEACRAIAAAKYLDEVKEIHDKAEAMRAYARQAKNRALEVDAAEIRVRAERRLGELILAQKATVGLRGPEHSRGGGSKGSKRVPLPSAPPILADAGIDKKLSSRAQKLGMVPEAKFEQMLGQWRARIEHGNERVAVDLLKQGDKAERRAAREAKLAAEIRTLPDKRYGIILADPEWRFEPWSRKTGMDRAADNHYPTSSTEVIAARDVTSIAADDCVLFLWATQPMLGHALDVMKTWDFDYRSHLIWRKLRPGKGRGTGYWFINEHEILLVGVKGDVPAPAPGTQYRSVIEAPVGQHSTKPEIFAEIIEQYFPNVPKIELNRRGPPRPSWDAWGNEAMPSDAGSVEAESVDLEETIVATVAPTVDQMPDLPEGLRRR